MRTLIILALFIISTLTINGQSIITGRVINAENGSPLAYAKVSTSKNKILTNIDGSFSLQLTPRDSIFSVSYIGFSRKTIALTKYSDYYLIKLLPATEELSAVMLNSEENLANRIIRKAIKRKE
ncbi:MAG TPA: carboxypeptidase-like regulatory domain-containing protein, partial [Gillisia sp.]|nr:carboxypeptidase-like regulatory domain-containing protein [Gillisia sp.]